MKNNKWLITNPIAHRGLHSNNKTCPENSIASFKKALNIGIPIEIDVQLSKDNEIIVFHDDNLKRMCGVNKLVSDLTLKEIKTLKLKNSNEEIPTLKELLTFIDRQIPILIEIKNYGAIGKLEELVNDQLINYSGDFAIQSFNPFSLNWFRKNNNSITRGLLISNFKDIKMNFLLKFILKNMYLNFLSKPNFIAVEISSLPSSRFNKYRNMNIPIIGWTIDSELKKEKANRECDNYIFELIDI